jgi:hypothetical protein
MFQQGGRLVGKAKPVMRATAPACAKSSLGKSFGPLELVARKHCQFDTANAEIRKDVSLAYKIT